MPAVHRREPINKNVLDWRIGTYNNHSPNMTKLKDQHSYASNRLQDHKTKKSGKEISVSRSRKSDEIYIFWN